MKIGLLQCGVHLFYRIYLILILIWRTFPHCCNIMLTLFVSHDLMFHNYNNYSQMAQHALGRPVCAFCSYKLLCCFLSYVAWWNNFPNLLPWAWRKRICKWKVRCGYSLLGTGHRKCAVHCSAQCHSLLLMHNRAVEWDLTLFSIHTPQMTLPFSNK